MTPPLRRMRTSIFFLFICIFSSNSSSGNCSQALSVTPSKNHAGNGNHAIIVGGGPIGLSTALTLAKQKRRDEEEKEFSKITIIETSKSLVTFDVRKAFLYNVNERGQAFLKNVLPGAQRKLEDRGVAGFGRRFLIVPGDKNKPLPPDTSLGVLTSQTNITIGETKKSSSSSSSTSTDSVKAAGDEDAKGATSNSYWIPRHEMVQILQEEIQEYNANVDNYRLCPIEVKSGYECCNIKACSDNDNAGEFIEVEVKDRKTSGSTTEKLTCNLLVGADGWKSKVRDCIMKDNDKTFHNVWNVPMKKIHDFKLKEWISPSTDIRIKVIPFPSDFTIPTFSEEDGKEETAIETDSQTTYSLRSKFTGPRSYLSLGLLPMKNSTAVRPANIVTRPDHEIWTKTTAKDLKEYMIESFPRFHGFTNIVSDDEWERVAKANGTQFPPCQYSPGMVVASPNNKAGIVLVGDSVHAFPPDIGQGINAGYADVLELHDCLSVKNEEEASLGSRLQQYETNRQPEIKSLIRLARFGSPYQYRQPHYIDRFRRNLWLINTLMRLVLSKVFPFISPSSMMLMQQRTKSEKAGSNEDDTRPLSYKEVMDKADRTTLIIKSVLLLGFGALFKKMFPF